jgi:hypothetical protein
MKRVKNREGIRIKRRKRGEGRERVKNRKRVKVEKG